MDAAQVGTGGFAQEWGKTLDGWEISEGKRAWDDWTLSPGGAANRTTYDSNMSKLWLIFGTVSTGLSTPGSSLAFLMHGDFNDGYARFFVDDQLIYERDFNSRACPRCHGPSFFRAYLYSWGPNKDQDVMIWPASK